MPHRVGNHHGARAALNRRRVKALQRPGIGPCGVFRDIHHGQPLLDREGNRVLGETQQLIERPPFRILADRTRPDERAALDGKAHALRDLRDGTDVGDHGARGAVRLHVQALVHDFAREPLDVAHDVRAGAGQPDVRRIDPEPIDQVQDAQLLLDGRAPHGRRLQPVAQRLVVKHHDGRFRRADVVPVVDERMHRYLSQLAVRSSLLGARPGSPKRLCAKAAARCGSTA